MSTVNKIIEHLKCMCGTSKRIKEIHEKVQEIYVIQGTHLSEMRDYKKKFHESENIRLKEQELFVSVIDHLDDMIWAKDKNGRYIMANKAFREKFCYGMTWDELQGKNDVEIATIFKNKVGNENHTFGEVCANSDELIYRHEQDMKFLEHGMIDGKLVKLVVNKSPLYDGEGTFYATCGSGRDVTEWHDDLERAIEASNACFGKEGKDLLLKELNKLEFKEGDHARSMQS